MICYLPLKPNSGSTLNCNYRSPSLFICVFTFLFFKSTQAQIGIGISIPTNSAQLEVASTSKGLLTPRMTAAQKSSIVTPATGLIIFQTDGAVGFYYFTGSNWVLISTTDITWLLNGNAGTNPSTAAIGSTVNNQFLGTTDNKDLVFASNNLERLRISNSGNIGIGIVVPTQKLELANGILLISNSNNTASEIRLAEPSASGNNYTAFKSQAQAANISYTLPAADGINGQVLTTNGAGNLLWTAPSTYSVSTSTIIGTGNFFTNSFPATTAGNLMSISVPYDGNYLIIFTGSFTGASNNKGFSIQLFSGTNTGITTSRINSNVPNAGLSNGAASHSFVASLTAGTVVGIRGISTDGSTVINLQAGNLSALKIN